MLTADNLGVRRGQRWVLEGLSLQLRAGEVLGVLGPNGAGKSTLLGGLCGELSADAGHVLLDDRALAAWAGVERARRVAVLPQASTLEFGFSVEQVVSMGRLPHRSGQARDAEVVAAALAATDCGHLQQRSYLALSGGERQRVHLARVLAQLWPEPGGVATGTLLLDEPTSMLDPFHQHTTLQAIRTFAAAGAAVLLILHDLNLAARYCDRILLLEQGKVAALGTPAQVLQAERLKQVFGLEVLVQAHPELGHPLIIAR